MDYDVAAAQWRRVLALPKAVADEYIRLTSGDQLKILLCFLSEPESTEDQLAEKVGCKRYYVEEAMRFWQSVGLLESKKPPESAEQPKQAARELTVEDTQYTGEEIATILAQRPDVKTFFDACERLYGRPLKHYEQNKLINVVQDNGLPPEVAVELVRFCVSRGKTAVNYILKTAFHWYASGIVTIAAAMDYVKTQDALKLSEIKAAFQMDKLSETQIQYVTQWRQVFSFGIDMIIKAMEITLDNTGKRNFKYMNSILARWHEQGIATPAQADAELKQKQEQNAQDNLRKPTFDLENW
jgi:DnaD/phage-associated family protein